MTFFTEATMSAIVTIYDNRVFSLPSGASFNRTEWSISVSPISTRADGKTVYEEIAVATNLKEFTVQPSATTMPNPDATVLPITTTREDASLSK
jgi:hypothetical protein